MKLIKTNLNRLKHFTLNTRSINYSLYNSLHINKINMVQFIIVINSVISLPPESCFGPP